MCCIGDHHGVGAVGGGGDFLFHHTEASGCGLLGAFAFAGAAAECAVVAAAYAGGGG